MNMLGLILAYVLLFLIGVPTTGILIGVALKDPGALGPASLVCVPIIAILVYFVYSQHQGLKKRTPDKRRMRRKTVALNVPTVYLDLETTGLDPGDNEVLEIAIIDDKGEILLNTLLKPTHRQRWPKAQSIHGISPKMVKDAPSIEAIADDIRKAVKDKRVVIYNAKFDVQFLGGTLNGVIDICCCMLRFSDFMKAPAPHNRPGYKWFKLEAAAKRAEHRWGANAHRALADVQATRTIWHFLNRERQPIEHSYSRRR